MYLFSIQTLCDSVFFVGVSMVALADWHLSVHMTCGKVLEAEPKFIVTIECAVQIDEAQIAGRAMYPRGRRLDGDRENNSS